MPGTLLPFALGVVFTASEVVITFAVFWGEVVAVALSSASIGRGFGSTGRASEVVITFAVFWGEVVAVALSSASIGRGFGSTGRASEVVITFAVFWGEVVTVALSSASIGRGFGSTGRATRRIVRCSATFGVVVRCAGQTRSPQNRVTGPIVDSESGFALDGVANTQPSMTATAQVCCRFMCHPFCCLFIGSAHPANPSYASLRARTTLKW